MSFKDLTFSWVVGVGYAGANHRDTIKVSECWTEEEWNDMSEKDVKEWLDDYLDTEVCNHLEANIWIDD